MNNDNGVTITITPLRPVCPAARPEPGYPEFHVYLYLDGALWDAGAWARVPAIGESLTNRALQYGPETAPLTFYTVQAVIGDSLGWETDWHVFLTSQEFPPAQQVQYTAALQQAWDAGAEARAWAAEMQRQRESVDGSTV